MSLCNYLASFNLVLVLFTSTYGYYESIYFDDGGYHKIDYILDAQVYVDRSSPGVGTQLELVEGGGIAPGEDYGSIYAFNDSQVTISGGQIGWSLEAHDRSKANLTGGYLGCEFFSSSINTAYISGGSVRAAIAYGNGSLDISGGTFRWSVETQGSTQAVITGGNIAGIHCLDSSRMYISGGTILGYINAGYYNDASSLITFYGSDFAINGQPVALGEYASSYCSYSGQVTGTLTDGSLLNTSFGLKGNADILFIPEPATVLLVGLGVLVLRRRRRA
ncbi:MAG: PEP-CTERM sorting domain-containing protein [Sedimentisphaerales bacterium]|nr:PEP-CTERM sorting domain-containing protein [Sedimentisphaerales bacterium]